MKMKSIIKFFSILTLLFGSNFVCIGQDRNEALLNNTIRKFKVKNSNIVQVLNKLSSSYNIPIGLIKATKNQGGEQTDKLISLSVKNVKLKTILNKVVKKSDIYRWKLDNNIIHFHPKDSENTILTKLSTVKIEKFNLSKEISYLNLRGELTHIKQVKEMLLINNIEASNIAFIINYNKTLPKYSIAFENVKFSEILDEIIKQGSHKMWILNLTGDKNDKLILNFLH